MTVEERIVEVRSDDIDLFCRAIVPSDHRGVVVLLHGIPSIAPPEPGDLGYAGMARSFADRGWASVWTDMRAVRESGGFFSIEGWVRDATAVVNAATELSDGFLALIGSSAGGSVSAEVTRRGAPVDALGLLAAPAAWLSFASDPAIGLKRITEEAGMAVDPDVLVDPTAWAAEFDSVTTMDAVADVHVPILIAHGTADDVVPVDHARYIADRKPDARVEIIEGAGHQLRRDERALRIVFDWLDEIAP